MANSVTIGLNREEEAFIEALAYEYQRLTGKPVNTPQIIHGALRELMTKMYWVPSFKTDDITSYSELLAGLKSTGTDRKRSSPSCADKA